MVDDNSENTDPGEQETFDDYENIYRTKFGPAVKTWNDRADVPSFTVVTALLSKLDQYSSKQDLVENEDYSIEQVEEALEFEENKDFPDVRKELDKNGFL